MVNQMTNSAVVESFVLEYNTPPKDATEVANRRGNESLKDGKSLLDAQRDMLNIIGSEMRGDEYAVQQNINMSKALSQAQEVAQGTNLSVADADVSLPSVGQDQSTGREV